MSTLSRTLVLLRELARRKVAHVAVLYGVGWFGALQVTQQFTQVYQLPQVISVTVSIGAVLLFPCVVFLSWCFDCTAEGIRRAPPTEELFAHERVVRVIVMVALVLASVAVATRTALGYHAANAAAEGRGSALPSVALRPVQDVMGAGPPSIPTDAVERELIEALQSSGAVSLRTPELIAAYEKLGWPPDSIARTLQIEYWVYPRVSYVADSLQLRVTVIDAKTGELKGIPLAATASRQSLTSAVEALTLAAGEHVLVTLGRELQFREWHIGTDSDRALELLTQAERRLHDADELPTPLNLELYAQRLIQVDKLVEQSARADPAWDDPVLMRARVVQRLVFAEASGAPTGAGHKLARAIEDLNELVRRRPRKAGPRAARAALLISQGVHSGLAGAEKERVLKAAEEDLRTALELDPKHVVAAGQLSELLYQRADFKGATHYADLALQIDPYQLQAAVTSFRLAMATFETGNDTTALRLCRDGQRRFPRFWQHYACTLEVLAWGNQPPDIAEAWRMYEAVQRLGTPSAPGSYYEIAMAGVLARAGAADSARAVLERVRTREQVGGSRDPNLLWPEAAVRFRLGETETAQRLLKDWLPTSGDELTLILRRRSLRDYVGFLQPDRPR